MKYQVGDLILVKECKYKNDLPYLFRVPLRLHNTFGIIIRMYKYNDIWENGSTESDYVYVWLSQVDGKRYCFYEEDLTEYEVVK